MHCQAGISCGIQSRCAATSTHARRVVKISFCSTLQCANLLMIVYGCLFVNQVDTTRVNLMPLFATTDGTLLAWDGRSTNVPPGFATLRLETNGLRCRATESATHVDRPTGQPCIRCPVHLLCRALRMAPASYGRFELTAAQSGQPLHVFGGHILTPVVK